MLLLMMMMMTMTSNDGNPVLILLRWNLARFVLKIEELTRVRARERDPSGDGR